MTAQIERWADKYAPHLSNLIAEMDKWVLRRVISASIASAD